MGLSKAPQENVNAFHFVWVGSHEPVLVCEVQLACVWRWETSRCSRASFINAAGDRRSVCRASHLALIQKHSCMLTGSRFFTIPKWTHKHTRRPTLLVFPSPAPPVHLAPHPGVVICSIFVSFILMLTLLLSLKYNMADCHLTGGSIKIAARVHGRVQSNSPPQAHKLLLYKSQFTIVCRHLLLPSHPSLSPATIISLSLWCRTP